MKIGQTRVFWIDTVRIRLPNAYKKTVTMSQLNLQLNELNELF